MWASARRPDRTDVGVWAVQVGLGAPSSASDILRQLSGELGRVLDVFRELPQNVKEGVFTNPLTALMVGIAIGACLGFAFAALGGSGWR